ncbi:hypothetical protein E4U32_003369, partial [Claviceps aff. humidiphila group G2b]
MSTSCPMEDKRACEIMLPEISPSITVQCLMSAATFHGSTIIKYGQREIDAVLAA